MAVLLVYWRNYPAMAGPALIRINSASAQLQEHASRDRGQNVGS